MKRLLDQMVGLPGLWDHFFGYLKEEENIAPMLIGGFGSTLTAVPDPPSGGSGPGEPQPAVSSAVAYHVDNAWPDGFAVTGFAGTT